MPQIAPIILADGQTTPVNQTYSPVSINRDGVAQWANRAGGIALGYPTVSLRVREPSKGSRNHKVTTKLVLPVLEQTSPSTATGIQPAPTLSHVAYANIEFVIPERASEALKKDLQALVKNWVANTAFITAAVVTNEGVY